MIQNDNNWPFVPAPIPPRTVHGVLWSKVLDALEDVSLHTVGKTSLAVVSTVALTVCLNYAPEAGRFVWGAALSFDGLLLKGAASALIVANHRKAWATLSGLFYREHIVPSVPTIDGIPVSELLDHLFTVESFKRDDVEAKFGIPRNRYDALGKKFDDMGITIRNQYRARILNPELSRQDIAAMLEGKQTAKELQADTLKRVGENVMSTRATGREIEDRVTASVPSFTIRRIAQK